MSNTTIIKDCIYRFIQVPDLCKSFIDTVEFQRLRHIKQLGLVQFTYPSAAHSRFEHSLGVMHLAGVGADISQREKELLQLAGLLHDVGHMAFSHLFDYMDITCFTRRDHVLCYHRSTIALGFFDERRGPE